MPLPRKSATSGRRLADLAGNSVAEPVVERDEVRPGVTFVALPHNRSDWVGFACFCLMAIFALIRAARAAALIVLPAITLDVAVGVTFLTRRPLRRQTTAVMPKVCAYAAAFGLGSFVLLAQRFRPGWLVFHSVPAARIVGFFIWLLGTVAAVFFVWRLRSAFSIVPQARELVTTGPYRFVRHPIYVCYLLQGIGYSLLYWNLPVLLAVVAWQSIMVARVRFEEQLLLSSFPEYADYRNRVGMFFPRLRPAPASRSAIASTVPQSPSQPA